MSNYYDSEEFKRKVKYLNSAFKRDTKFCKCCLSPFNLETHHIIPIEVNPKKALDRNNLIVLCRNCHRLRKYSIHRMLGNTYTKTMFYLWLYTRFAFINLIRVNTILLFILILKGAL